jgi:hypothetical protein
MMDIISVQEEITRKIQLLEIGRKLVRERAVKKAEAIANYEKVVALTIMQLKMGRTFELDGVTVGGQMAANLLEKLAKGICWQERLETERADGEYKAAVVGIESVISELNGWQSIFRRLDYGSREGA